jgi:hypothetical protein
MPFIADAVFFKQQPLENAGIGIDLSIGSIFFLIIEKINSHL